DEPARVDGKYAAAAFYVAWKQDWAHLIRGSRRQTRCTGLELPELVTIARSLLLDRVGLFDRRRPEDVDLDARQHLFDARVAPAEDVRIFRHRHQVLDRARIGDIAFTEKSDFLPQADRQVACRKRLMRDLVHE